MSTPDHFQRPILDFARRDFTLLDERLSIQEALDTIRQRGIGERIVYFYTVNAAGRLTGVLPTRRLLTAPAAQLAGHTSAAAGATAAVTTATWSGWIARRPTKPSRRARLLSASSPAASRKSAYSVSTGATPAAAAANRHWVRANW